MNNDNPASGDAPARWPRLSRDLGLGRNNGILFWVHLIWGAGFTIQAALWTLFIEDLGASPTQIGLVVGGGAVVRTLLAISAGILADRFPLKPVIIAMMAVPIFGAISLALATQWWHALFGAVLMDLSGVAIPAVSAYVAAASKPEDRTRTMTYIFSLSWLISMTVAPAIGGWRTHTASASSTSSARSSSRSASWSRPVSRTFVPPIPNRTRTATRPRAATGACCARQASASSSVSTCSCRCWS